jgi:Cdc6-like AAA superfamily ATPase
VAGEICDGKIKNDDVEKAQKIIQKDRVNEIVANASYHMRCVVGAIVSLAIVKEQSWSATSNIFKKYTEIVSEDNPLKYRRVSDLLVELENTGILVSRAYSHGRGGYGKEYKLKVDPSIVGPSVSEEFYDLQVQRRAEADKLKEYQKLLKSRGRHNFANMYSRLLKDF